MFPKYILVLLMITGVIGFAWTKDDPCDGKPFSELVNCPDDEGKFLFERHFCYENEVQYLNLAEGVPQVDCIKPGWDFKTKEECEEKCKVEISKYGDPGLIVGLPIY